MSRTSSLGRREFLLRSGAAAVAATALGRAARAEEARAKVVIVTCPDVMAEGGPPNKAALRRMMDAGIGALAGKNDVKAAWQTFIRPTEQVALVDAGTWLMNVPEVVLEVMRGIKLAQPDGLKFTYCKYSGQNAGFMDTIGAGMAELEVPKESLEGGVYTIPCSFDKQPFSMIVMVPTLKSHSIAGVSGVVKHYATMSNKPVSSYHANGMETCGMVFAEQFAKLRNLIVVDALRWGKQRQGPTYYQKALIFGTDPVATDVVALDLFLKNVAPDPKIDPKHHRLLADTQYHAGISDLARIDVQEVKV